MGTMSTFGSFGIARLGIYASQKAMQVTGNNITNVNTTGYTRQELELQSLYVGGADRYSSRYDMKIGSGVLCTGVQQIRSPYLDIRYRTEMSNVGAMDAKLSALNQLNIIFDEVGDGEDSEGIMEAALQGLIEQLEYYSSEGAGREEFDTIVRGSTKDIVTLFNDYANRLEKLYSTQVTQFRQDVNTVNNILSEIQKLNNSIRKAEIHGSNALELKDDRNLLIDQLSQYVRIDVIYESEDVGAGILVDKLVIKLDSNDPNSPNDGAILIDGKYATQLVVPDLEETDEDLLASVHQFSVTLDTLKDMNGEVCKQYGYYQSGVYNELTEPGTMTIAGYSVNIAADDITGKVPDRDGQLQAFVDAFNNDLANTRWVAKVQTADDGTGTEVPTGRIEFVPRTADDDGIISVDSTDIKPDEDENGNQTGFLTIAGYTVDVSDVLAAGGTADDLIKAFVDAYNDDENNTQWTAEDDGNGGVIFTLTDEEAAKVPPMLANTVFVQDMTRDPMSYPVVELTDNDLYGALQAEREMLTEKGEFADDEDSAIDPSATTKYGIPYYRKMWDAMAIKFASLLNEANTMVDSDGNLVKDSDGNYVISPANYYQKDEDGDYIDTEGNKLVLVEYETPTPEGNVPAYTFYLKDQYESAVLGKDGKPLVDNGFLVDLNGQQIGAVDENGDPIYDENGDPVPIALTNIELTSVVAREQYTGGILLSNSGNGDSTEGLCAKNISISYSWSNGAVRIMKSRTDSEFEQSSQNSNLLHMVSILRDNTYDYRPGQTDAEFGGAAGTDEGPVYFSGNFGGLLTKIESTLAEETRVTQSRLSDYLTIQTDLEVDRESVSGVDINDEAISMMQYNRAYAAACRLMTTLDEMLDKLINGTAV